MDKAYRLRRETLARRKNRPDSPEEIAITVFQSKHSDICVEYADLIVATGGDLTFAADLVAEGLPLIRDLYTKSPTNKPYRDRYVARLATAAEVAARRTDFPAAVVHTKAAMAVLDGAEFDDAPYAPVERAKCRGRLADYQIQAGATDRDGVLAGLDILGNLGPTAKTAEVEIQKLTAVWTDTQLKMAANQALTKIAGPGPR